MRRLNRANSCTRQMCLSATIAIAATLSIITLPSLAATVTPHVGLTISRKTTISPGAYRLSDGDSNNGIVLVSGADFTVDFNNARLVGSDGKGTGVSIRHARNITIKNLEVSGYRWGVVLEDCENVRIIHCTASRNADLPPGTVIDESGTEPEDTHGGGFVIRDSRKCLVERCIAVHEWDGIDVVRSKDCLIENGDYSYNGNWGLHLWNSSGNTFRKNRAIWCTTGSGLLYQALTGWQTYDAQAVGIDHNSCDNTIEENDLRFGGDAIFIRANEGGATPGTQVPPKNASDRNRLINNDCSYSPNNAIEVDFVDGTIITGNNCSNSNYGLWLGYSRNSKVRNNICVNDSNHAIEIENGQNGHFEGNVFGWDVPRENGQLILLRQNGGDKTPSGPYTIDNNLFYGGGVGVQLTHTTAMLHHNYFGGIGKATVLVRADVASVVTEESTALAPTEGSNNAAIAYAPPYRIRANGVVSLQLPGYEAGDPPPVVELEGVPLWVRAITPGTISVQIPPDSGLSPAKSMANLKLLTRTGSVSWPVIMVWQPHQPRITQISPTVAKIGDNLTVVGQDLAGGRFLINGKPAVEVSRAGDTVTLKSPEGILVPTRFNLVYERGEGRDRVATSPCVLTIAVPSEQMPHLVSAEFSPHTVKVGELLKVTMRVRNNLPVPALLTTSPAPTFTYDEKQACYEMGYNESPRHLNLRVSTDFFVGGHHPGSWPWMFGFDRESLAPGETVTITGYVRLQTPGVHMFRIGLVAGGFRFIDDNAYQTRITVTP